MKTKQTIYWDVDDVALDTLPTMIELINQKFNRPNGLPDKTLADAKDWNMKSIYRYLTRKDLESLFSSQDFWDNVKLKPGFTDLLSRPILRKYNNVFLTVGTPENLKYKRDFLERELGKKFKYFTYIGIESPKTKASVKMPNDIIIDDNIKNLIETNAAIKILLKNNLDTLYNNAYGSFNDQLPDNLYVVNSLDEVEEILNFNLKRNLTTL